MNMTIVTEYKTLLERKAAIDAALPMLPQGYISHKNINGKTYAYLQNRIAGKVVSEYLKGNDAERISEQLATRRQYESELPALCKRLGELEQAARLVGNGFDRTLMLLKSSVGMDEIDTVQKEKCVSFANAMNAIEGVPVSQQTAKDISDWQRGKKSFLSVFEATLKRYGFTCGGAL